MILVSKHFMQWNQNHLLVVVLLLIFVVKKRKSCVWQQIHSVLFPWNWHSICQIQGCNSMPFKLHAAGDPSLTCKELDEVEFLSGVEGIRNMFFHRKVFEVCLAPTVAQFGSTILPIKEGRQVNTIDIWRVGLASSNMPMFGLRHRRSVDAIKTCRQGVSWLNVAKPHAI